MTAVMTEPGVPAATIERRCRIDEVFAGPFIDLIALAPRNPIVRGLILAQTRKLPGLECETFEQIKDWVELTCDRKTRPLNAARSSAGEGISIRVEFSETEYGKAYYSVPCSGSDEVALDADELLAMIREVIADGDGLNAVVEKIASLIDDEAWNRCSPSLDDYGDYDYSEHDSNGTENSAVEFSRTQVRDRLLAFLREQHPELLEDLT
jgi:hypothetical protein